MSKLVKPSEYAKEQGISRQAVYAKIKKGALPSKTVDGKMYIVVDKDMSELLNQRDSVESSPSEQAGHLIDVKELLNSKEQTITILKESISDLKQTNTEINTTLRGEIELLKQVFTEMRNLYVKQVDYMSTEKKLELENKYSKREIAAVEEVHEIEGSENTEDECWMPLDEFFERNNIRKSKLKAKVVKRLRKAYGKEDDRIKIDDGTIMISCYHYYEDILNKK